MKEQFNYFLSDFIRLRGKYKLRVLHIWLSRSFWAIFLYRLERGLFLLIGVPYKYIRVLFLPILYPIQAYANIEIHYKANIKGGLIILHPAVGAVISAYSAIGKNLTLTGGNIIGGKPGCKSGEIILGDNITLGANAVVIGPIQLGDNITIGALACVVQDCLVNNSTLVGVPAVILKKNNRIEGSSCN